MSKYEQVAASVLVLPDDQGALSTGWWAPEGSDWRPVRHQRADELHVHLPETDALYWEQGRPRGTE